ncbi:MAG TPA: class I SAM-dependent methyltransferase [Actinomycetes bacterium]|nr:class I SAM-dependent methyltransferase [Actinomycetes bacterium]
MSSLSGVDPASFRDPHSAVLLAGDQVLRRLSPPAADDWRRLREAAFFARRVSAGEVIGTEELDAADRPDVGDETAWPVVLRHDRIPFVSYPYEWCFSQLQDVGALHIDLLLDALAERLTMKDGYAYNLQFRGAAPVFIDVGSFEAYGGGPWAGYRQFCQTILFPLLLQAHRNVSYRPLLRGQVNGIEPVQMRALMGGRDLMRTGVLKHVVLHSAVDARSAGKGDGSRATAEKLRDSGYSDAVALAAARNVGTLVRRLRWKPGESHWTTYQQTSTYTDDERQQKTAFVTEALARQASRLVLDLGCNDGTFARVAQEHADYVVAVDGDEQTIDALYRQLRAEGNRAILPLVMDLTDPSPAIGWRSRERASFLDRARPDAVLALALVHHLAIGANVPLPEVVSWLHGFGGRLVVEFVEPTDPMAQRLLANKPEGLFPDYRREVFEELLAARFRVEKQVTLTGGTRTLYAAVPHG